MPCDNCYFCVGCEPGKACVLAAWKSCVDVVQECPLNKTKEVTEDE